MTFLGWWLRFVGGLVQVLYPKVDRKKRIWTKPVFVHPTEGRGNEVSSNLQIGSPATIYDLQELNRCKGYHFWSAGSMRFFDSWVEPFVYVGADGWYFVTSEQFHGSRYSNPRKWTVRRMNQDGSVSTVGEGFNRYRTSGAAHGVAVRLAADSQKEG